MKRLPTLKSAPRGFTLIELMVVVAVIAVIALIAYPSFVEQLRRSRRSDASAALQRLQLAQERFRASNTSYGATPAAVGESATSQSSYYALSFSGVSATGYTATATAQGAQAGDGKCAKLTLTFAGGAATRGSSPSDPSVCWK